MEAVLRCDERLGTRGLPKAKAAQAGEEGR